MTDPAPPLIYVCFPTTKERRPRLAAAIESVQKNTFPHIIVIYENNDGGCVAATHKMLQGIDGLVFILNDDMTIGPHCLETLFKNYVELGFLKDVLLQPFDGINHGKVAVSPFCHSDTIKKYLFKGYVHNFNDTELTEVMQSKGKYFYVRDALMEHHHEYDKKKQDKTYKLSQTFLNDDHKLYLKRKANGFEPKNIFP